MAILAMVFVSAFWAQSKAVDMKNEAKWNILSGLMVQRVLSTFQSSSFDDLAKDFSNLDQEYPGFHISIEAGLEPFSDIKDLREFQIEISGPVEGFRYKTKLLLFTGNKKK